LSEIAPQNPATKRALEYQNDIIGFAYDILGVEHLFPYQENVLLKMANNQRVVITACHDVGKTFLAAIFLIWALVTHWNSSVISTAPSFGMVKNLLWREIAKLWKNMRIPDIGGELLETRIEIDREKWFAIGISPKTDAGQNDEMYGNFVGFHNRYVFVIFDEAPGVPHQRWKTMKAMMTSAKTWFCGIGNPISPTGDFKEACDSPFYEVVQLSCFDSPNLAANGMEGVQDLRDEAAILQSMTPEDMKERMAGYKVVHGELLSLQWVMQQWIEEGEDSPFVQARVLGIFPKESSDTILSYGQVQNAMTLDIPMDNSSLIVGGCDCARFGNDSTIIYIMKGNHLIYKEKMNKRDTVEVTDKCDWLIKKYKTSMFGVDDTGMNGVTDQLRHRGHKIYAFLGSSEPRKKSIFLNKRAEAYWLLAKDVKKEQIKLLDDKKLLKQLPATKYEFKGALLKIEDKAKIKQRIGQSPDEGDALSICNYLRHRRTGGGAGSSKEAKETSWGVEDGGDY